jgi:pimeloyl-ACP methyl ester carboxylesterase
MHTVEVDGITVAFQCAGEGPALLLLHGGLSDSRAWAGQWEMSDEFTLVAWDAPGCGQSSDPPDSFRLPQYADCVATLIEEFGLDHPHVLGISFGAGLALELYRRHPHLPATLILASAYAGWAGSLTPEQVQRRLARALREAEQPPQQWVHAYVSEMLTDNASPEFVAAAVGMMLETRPAGMVPMLRAFAEADLRDVLPHIRVPTLLLYGADDVRSPLSVAEDLHARIPTSQLVVMPNVGHDSNLEAPVAFNTAVRRFLRSARVT